MISIDFGESNLKQPYTIQCSTVQELEQKIQSEKINLQDAIVKFRAIVPGIAFEEIVKDILGSGGKVL